MCHQPPPLHATVPESRSPSPGEVCEASSRQSRNGKDRVDAGAAVRILHAYPSSSIRRPEPVGQRGLRPVKNGPGGQRDLVTALDALLASLLHQLIGSPMPASRTDEAIRPPTSRQILLASLFRGEVRLKLAERLRERRSRYRTTLPVGVC